mmetsp:Transcript_56667/g.67884  ORF Transcript_56667/g.67884 Transcript_56667/m.67884 type:complete len:324 (-) Transcript_56667:136-1107(-)|eukprot:CAMPEP_0172487308 /NCGR_PEP_ID=MMETSP1066-20121228/16342_1 /TAXON_ID=671091 /ORGANISM="Coscinodiscus wailesii, Strain CCMP2513" /LENGTH=323 /DNA_ID=CAMNT_0013253841 /DNA_START=35 /DNA_END=1006 /DNA_ORIENTATION=-
MNNRLGDLGIEETPAWATEDATDNDVDHMENGEGPSANNEDKDDASDDGLELPQKNAQMDQFFKDVEVVKQNIELIKASTKRIGEINEEAILATDSETEAKLSAQLDPIIKQTNKSAKGAKTMLAFIKETTGTLKEKKEVKASDLRVRENLCNTLTRKFIDEMKEYQNSQQKYKADIKKKAKRQIQIVKPDATEEEVDEIMNSEGGRDALYRETILSGGVNDNIKTAYQNVVGKYQDVRTLENSVAELHQMFLDFALLTEQQGELLDQIEFNVKSAGDYIEEGNEDVFQALEYQKSVRKKQCMILLIVAVVTLVLLFSLGILP